MQSTSWKQEARGLTAGSVHNEFDIISQLLIAVRSAALSVDQCRLVPNSRARCDRIAGNVSSEPSVSCSSSCLARSTLDVIAISNICQVSVVWLLGALGGCTERVATVGKPPAQMGPTTASRQG